MTITGDLTLSTIVDAGASGGDVALDLVVQDRREIAQGVVELTLAAPDGADLPAWEPGAHIDLVLADGLTRQYSLCGDPADRDRYRIAVLREPEGRGGSRRIHDELTHGSDVGVKGPRNHFAFHPSKRYIFIAGGIGVTPMLPMVRAADEAGAEWTLVYGGRTDASMSYLDEFEPWSDKVTIWPEDRHGRIDLDSILGTPQEDTLVYCCGPEPLLAAIEERCANWPRGALNLERFSAAVGADDEVNASFDVELRQTGTTLRVEEDQSILEVVTDAGVYVPTSCTEGTCGSCETPVLEGVPDHRDVVLSPEEQDSCEMMMICVSRCKSGRLVLDL